MTWPCRPSNDGSQDADARRGGPDRVHPAEQGARPDRHHHQLRRRRSCSTAAPTRATFQVGANPPRRTRSRSTWHRRVRQRHRRDRLRLGRPRRRPLGLATGAPRRDHGDRHRDQGRSPPPGPRSVRTRTGSSTPSTTSTWRSRTCPRRSRRIRDTDMAQEMVSFTRSQILTQAGTACWPRPTRRRRTCCPCCASTTATLAPPHHPPQ